jgi:hypothetical protein
VLFVKIRIIPSYISFIIRLEDKVLNHRNVTQKMMSLRDIIHERRIEYWLPFDYNLSKDYIINIITNIWVSQRLMHESCIEERLNIILSKVEKTRVKIRP